MDRPAKQEAIRNAARRRRSGGILWSQHAAAKLVLEDLTRTEVETALQLAEVIEDYPAVGRPLPDCLVLGFLEGDRPIHVVVAIDTPNDRLFIATLYRPVGARWSDDHRTRLR